MPVALADVFRQWSSRLIGESMAESGVQPSGCELSGNALSKVVDSPNNEIGAPVSRVIEVLDTIAAPCVLMCLAVFAFLRELTWKLLWVPGTLVTVRYLVGKVPRMVLVDYTVLAVSASYGIQLIIARTDICYPRLAVAFVGISLYWLVRIGCRDNNEQDRLISGIASALSVLSCATLYASATWIWMFHHQGFQDVSAFKSQLPRVLARPINEWATVALLGLIFQAACVRISEHLLSWRNLWSYAGVAIISTAAFLTFSRGVYVAVVVFLLALVTYCVLVKEGKRPIILVILVVLAGAAAANRMAQGAVVRTATFGMTEQQRRSANSRWEVWNNSFGLVLERPFLGSGPGTFSMRYVPRAQMGEFRPFVGRPLNTPFRILIEEGAAGLAAYCLLIMATLAVARPSVVRTGKYSVQRAVLLSGLIALVTRELTFSSFLEVPVVTGLSWILVASLVNESTTKRCEH